MRALLLLTVANIKSFTRDGAALFWTIAFPLIFVFLFGSIVALWPDAREERRLAVRYGRLASDS